MGLFDFSGPSGQGVLGQRTPISAYRQEDFDVIKEWSPAEYETIKQYDPRFQAEQRAAQEAQQTADIQAQIAAAQASGPAPAPAIDPAAEEAATRSDALARLNAILPAGFEQTMLPGTLDDPFVEQVFGRERGKATDVLDTLLRRGTVTESGRTRGLQAIESQAPGVRSRLSDIGNLLLEQERAGLRGVRGGAEAAIGGLPAGGSFDPGPYLGQAQQRIADFSAGLGPRFEAGVPAGLFDVSGVEGAAGAVQGPQNLAYDPYAVSGGQLQTGLEERPAPGSQKKRTTAVF